MSHNDSRDAPGSVTSRDRKNSREMSRKNFQKNSGWVVVNRTAMVGLRGVLLAASLTALLVTGCTTVDRARTAVVEKTQQAVEAVKRTAAVVTSPRPKAENSPAPPAPSDASTRKIRPVSKSDEFEITGMLSAVRPKDCLASKGCEPMYRLYNQNFSIPGGEPTAKLKLRTTTWSPDIVTVIFWSTELKILPSRPTGADQYGIAALAGKSSTGNPI